MNTESAIKVNEKTILAAIPSRTVVFEFAGWNTGERFIRLSGYEILKVREITSGLWESAGEDVRRMSDGLGSVIVVDIDAPCIL
jgi:hypothetical protein